MLKKKMTGLKVVDEAKGIIQAVFATLNVKDHDGDVTVPGAFEDGAAVRISAYNHKSWDGALPVGRGTITEKGDEAILDGQFFMDTEAGRETFGVVKGMGDLQEWSYGFDVLQSEPGTFDGESANFLKRVKVHEVSPVILGAGIATRTLAVKAKMEKQLASELYDRLRTAGTEAYGSERTYVYVDDVDIDGGWVVYCISSADDGERYMRVDYLRGSDGAVVLGDGEEEVERTATYRPKGSDTDAETKAGDEPSASEKGADAETPQEEPEPEATKGADEDEEPEQTGTKLADQLDAAVAAAEAVATRVADAVAQRAENGQKLAEATLERATQLKSIIERLQEALATEPPPDDIADDWGEGLDIEHDLAQLG